jgi:glycine cleavage system H lipoate-binding protein
MFPGVDGFRWDAGHIIFLGAFFSVVTLVAITMMRVWLRSFKDRKPARVEAIRWHSDFHELPGGQRCCRHEIAGEVEDRKCPNEFDCRKCSDHANWPTRELATCDSIAGISVAPDRFYHRGHAWLRREEDGTCTIGLDDFATRVLGTPDVVKLPASGSQLYVNGLGWQLTKGKDTLRVLSPVEGEVLATAAGEDGWFLKVKPSPSFKTTHLLEGVEAAVWMNREFERLQIAVGEAAPALADGGLLVDDLEKECPKADWDAIRGNLLLQP